MKSRYFRHLFEGGKDGYVQIGSVWNNVTNKQTNYMYIAGAYAQNYETTYTMKGAQIEREDFQMLEEGSILDLCVLGTYTYHNIARLLRVLRRYPTCTVILPYITPLQRLYLAHHMPTNYVHRNELIYFLDFPYDSLRKTGVENIYFLYQNGKPIAGELDELAEGYHFELLGDAEIRRITEMEGNIIPVLHSGYILENQWLFYFGTFGPKIDSIQEFINDYVRNYHDEEKGDFQKLDEMMECFEDAFGISAFASIIMYHGPIHDNPQETSSIMMGKKFPMERGCHAVIPKDGRTCALKCQNNFDYDYLQHYKNKKQNKARMGILFLGNVSLKKNLSEILAYFTAVLDKVRAIAVPDCGSKEYWDSQILSIMNCEDVIYWFMPIEKNGKTEVLMEIITAKGYHRLVNINKEYGYCFSGYLVPCDEY